MENKYLAKVVISLTLFCFIFLMQQSFSIASPENFSQWTEWKDAICLQLKDTANIDRINEPFEISINLPSAKVDGSDIRVLDDSLQEIPFQIIDKTDNVFKMCFLVNISRNSTRMYYVLCNNSNASAPNYPLNSYYFDNNLRIFYTGDVYIKWGEKAGGYDEPRPSPVDLITCIQFDDSGFGMPWTSIDRLTDDWNGWDRDKSYGYLGSNISLEPIGFGSGIATVNSNGPIFTELKLGCAVIRSYKGKKHWIVTNGCADSVMFFGHWYDYEKHGRSQEQFIHNNGLGDVGPWVTYYEGVGNPEYICFRRSDNGLIFGAVGLRTNYYAIAAKESGGYDRIISFNDSSNRQDAKIYWYSDNSNSYAGIERLAKQVLNPLQVTIIQDNTPPETQLNITPEQPDGLNEWYVSKPKLELSSNEAGTTYFKVDDKEYELYAEPIEISEGVHTINYYSVDNYNNIESEKSLTVKVDVSKPQIFQAMSPSRANYHYYIGEPIMFSCDSTDLASGIYAVISQVDDQLINNYESKVFNAIGEHQFVSRSIDYAGNEDTVTNTFTIGYGFNWLYPITQEGNLVDNTYKTPYSSSIPIRFRVADMNNKFIVDKTVAVVITDGENTALFRYGKTNNDVRINACEARYLLNINATRYPWMSKGGRYKVFVYFGGYNQYLGVKHGELEMELI